MWTFGIRVSGRPAPRYGGPGRPQMPSSRRRRGASTLAISFEPSRRRVRLVGLLSRLWRFPDPACMSFPVPVTLTRFFVPECVLFFGMASCSHSLSWCWSGAISRVLLRLLDDSGTHDVAVVLFRIRPPAAGGGRARTPCPLVGPVDHRVSRGMRPPVRRPDPDGPGNHRSAPPEELLSRRPTPVTGLPPAAGDAVLASCAGPRP